MFRRIARLAQHNYNNKTLAVLDRHVLYSKTRNIEMWKRKQALRLLWSVSIVVFLAGAASPQAQTLSLRMKSNDLNFTMAGSPAFENDIVLANHILAALKRLQAEVIVYRSLPDFESEGRIARVSVDVFVADLDRVSREVEPALVKLSDKRLRAHLTNALHSYRDGAFWWARIDQRRVVTIKELSFASERVAPTEVFFAQTTPYTVAIHWRQASKFLGIAEQVITPKASPKF